MATVGLCEVSLRVACDFLFSAHEFFVFEISLGGFVRVCISRATALLVR